MMINQLSSPFCRHRAFVQTSARFIFSQERYFCDLPTNNQKQSTPMQLLSNKLQLYAGLSKFRLSALVVVTSGAGYMAAGVPFDAGGLVLKNLIY